MAVNCPQGHKGCLTQTQTPEPLNKGSPWLGHGAGSKEH